MSAFLANTSSEGLTPLGSAPQRSWELISGTVQDALGSRHAALFAEPEGTAYGDRFDWYASTSGTPRPLTSLEDGDRALAEATLDNLLSDIKGLSDSLLDDSDPDKQRLGEALANAVRYPGPESVYVVNTNDGPQPILVNWAWVADTQVAATGSLTGTGGKTAAARAKEAAAQPTTVVAAAPLPPPSRRGPLGLWWLLWLGWLLLMLMIGAILYLMIEACALRIPGLPNYCPPPGPTVSELERDARILRDQIAAVERQIGIADRACQPQQAAAPTPPPEEDAFDRRLADAGAQRGDLTFSLLWEGRDDVDLHVTCPTGQTLYFRNRRVCAGTLDVDSNAGGSVATDAPVENIFFNGPQAGTYKIRVHLYKTRTGSLPRNFQLRIYDHGQTQTLNGSLRSEKDSWTHTYQTRAN